MTRTQAQRIRSIDRKFAWPSLKRLKRVKNDTLVLGSVRRKDFDRPVREQTIISVREGERLLTPAETVSPTLCIDCKRPVSYGMLCADCRRVVERVSQSK